MPFLLNEDEALKKKLKGITVVDSNGPTGGRPVEVRFRLPEVELGDITFPLIVIEHRPMSRAEEREHRGGFHQLQYSPDGFDPLTDPTSLTGSPYFIDEWPIPMNLDYVVRVFARSYSHTMQIETALISDDRLHPRFAYLDIPQDGTVRRLETIGGPYPADVLDQQNKRYFQRIWNLRVSSELLPSKIWEFNTVVNKLEIDLNYYSDAYDVPIDHIEVEA